MISIPALIVLLVMGMGMTYFLLITSILDQAATLPPEQAAHYVNFSLYIFIAFILLAILSSIGLVITLHRPIRQLSDAVTNMIHGNMRANIDLHSGALEMDELGKNFNSMVDFINSMIEQREAYLSDTIQSGCITLNLDGRVTSINLDGLSILDADRENFVGKTVMEIRRDCPDLAPAFMSWCQMQMQNPEKIKAREVEIKPGKQGEKSIAATASLLRDKANNPTAILLNFRDNASKNELKDMFIGTDQLAALGTFTHGLSDELRNPLGALKGSTQLLSEMLVDKEDTEPYIKRILVEVNRLDHLVRELHSFSHAPLRKPEECQLEELAKKSIMWAQQQLEESAKAEKQLIEEYAEGLPPIIAQSDRIIRAITNIIINAYENTPAGESLTIRTGLLEPSGGPVILEIINTGTTIPEKDLNRIFEPFFSTKRGGAGLGLAISYQIAAQNRARLTVESKDNVTLFRFVFRVVREK